MSRILQRAQAGIAAFALPLLISSVAFTLEVNVTQDGVGSGGPCGEASEPCLPRQMQPGVPSVSPALSDVLGRGGSHHIRGKPGEPHWIYSEGHQTNYPKGSKSAVQSLITTAAGTATIYTDGTATFTPANSADGTVPVDVYGIAGQGIGIFFSNGTAYFVPPAPGSNLGNILADKNQIVNNDAN